MKKFVEKLGIAYTITTLVLFSGTTWGIWYTVVYLTSSMLWKWIMGLLPVLTFIVAIVIVWRSSKNEDGGIKHE